MTVMHAGDINNDFYVNGKTEITSIDTVALSVGRQGLTNPVLQVDASTTTVVTGIKITGAATGTAVAIAAIGSATNELLTIDAKGTGTIKIGTISTGAITLGAAAGAVAIAVAGTLTVTSADASAFAVGRLGATTPAFAVSAATATQVAGLKVTGGATIGTVAVAVVGDATNVGLTINSLLAGTILIGNVSTGAVTITPATTVTGVLTTSNILNVNGVNSAGGIIITGSPGIPTAPAATVNATITFNAGTTGSAQIDWYRNAVRVGLFGFDPGGGSVGAYTTLSTDFVARMAATLEYRLVLTAGGNLYVGGALNANAASTITSAGAQSLAVGLTGATNPAFVVDSSTALQVAGLSVKGAVTAGTVAIACLDSGAAASLTIDGKGSGTVGIGTISTGAINLGVASGTTPVNITSASAAALSVGRLGATTPAFAVSAATATQVAGLKITGGATAGTVALAVIGDGTNVGLTINALLAGTILIGNVSTGTVTIPPATTITGAATLTGGVVAVNKRRHSTVNVGDVAYASVGTAKTFAANTCYFIELWLPSNKTLTGAAVLNAATVGTTRVSFNLYNNAGTLVANTTVAGNGTLTSGANAFQEIAFTSTYAAVGPARYWLAIQSNNSAVDNFRAVAASTHLVDTGSTGSVEGTALATITPPTTFTADLGPVGYVY